MNLKITKSNISNFYSIILAWVPLLGIYKSFIPGVSIGEFFLLICSVLSIIFPIEKKIIKGERVLILFAIYSMLSTMILFIVGEYEFFWLHRLTRMVFYIYCICFVSRNLFQMNLFFKSTNYLGLLLFGGTIMQYLVYLSTGQYIRLFGNFLPLMEEQLLNLDYQYIIRVSIFRPSSFLTEPSHVAQVMAIPLVYNLYHIEGEKKRKSIILIIIDGATILLSKSLWGYAILVLSVAYWFIDSGKKRHTMSWYFLLPTIIVLGGVILINTSLFKDTFSRIDLFDLNSSSAFTGRFGGYDILELSSQLKRIFGAGFAASVQDRPITNSVLFLLYGSGYIGTAIIALFFVVTLYDRYSYWQRTLTVVLFILMFGTNILFSTRYILVCSCIMSHSVFLKE